jgi:quercetin dioxygenase-like cupin family protein
MTTAIATANAASAAKHCVLRPDQIKSHDRGGGARTTPLVLPSIGASTFINGITEFAPGTKIPFHSHNCEESVVLLEGHAYMDINGEVHELKPLDTTFIPPNVPHRFRNKSDTEPMKILWIYASVHATRTLTESGETRPITAEHNR